MANLLRILSLTTGNSPVALAEEIGDGGGGKLKQAVTDALNAYLRPIRSRRVELAAQLNCINGVLERGIQRAREVGAQTITIVSAGESGSMNAVGTFSTVLTSATGGTTTISNGVLKTPVPVTRS